MSEHSTDSTTELEGRIASLDATARTLVIDGTTVAVPTTATIRHGHTNLTFADLKVGDQVHVKGTRSTTGVTASAIVVQTDDDDDADNDASNRASAAGKVSGLTGTCPAVSFKVATTTVTTTSTTVFRDGSCAELANGVTARVRGTRQADGSIKASHVFFEDNDTEGAHASGAIAGLSGTCPTVTFTLGSTKVSTDASTTFRGGSCATLVNGTNVSVRGTAAADGSITASRVSVAESEDD